MRKILLKFLTFVFLFGSLTPLMSCSDNNDNEMESIVTFNKLPEEAQKFYNTYFNGYTILKINKETIGNISIYELYLEDGYVVVFNNAGNWTEVYASENMSIPDGIVPPVIQEYLDQNYPDYGVNEINKTGTGYKVVLVTGLQLYFNEAGEFVKIGNDY